MSEETADGIARTVRGKVEDAVGGLTGDTSRQAQGKLDQAAGNAQRMLGDAKQTAASAADEVKAAASGVAERVTAAASDFGQTAYEKTADVASKVGGQLRENPVTAMIAAGLLGGIVGYLLGRPPSERAIQIGRARLAY